jgi:hypothetical protein
MNPFVIQQLHALIAEVAPIDGISVGDDKKKETWRIDFKSDATDEQKVAAKAVVEQFDQSLVHEPRLILKSVIVDRLHRKNLLLAAFETMNAQDIYTQQRWLTRNAIYADDPTAVAFLRAIGADPDEILAP